MGYHVTEIPKGELGRSSKIKEELLELMDAELQRNKILALVELSDLYGSIEHYLKANYPAFTMQDLAKMSNATSRAFEEGHR
jgi:hypothetical protein